MKVAFLFDETCPNYDLALRLIQAVPPDEREAMSTHISAGLWGIGELATGLGLRNAKDVASLIARLIYNQEGSLTRLVSDERIIGLTHNLTFLVIVHSIHRSLTLYLHERLKEMEAYHGFVQVFPHLASHRQVFGGCSPSMKLERKTLFVWSSGDPDDGDESDEARMADEIVTWTRENYPLLDLSVQTKAIGFKGSILDDDSDNTFNVQQTVQEAVEDWATIAERVIHKLDDFAPDVLKELNSALVRLNQPKLTASDTGQVAVSLRRSLELLANLLLAGHPEKLAEIQSRSGPQHTTYMKLVWAYLDEHFPPDHETGWDVVRELKSLNTMLNKGVHEHWISDHIRPLAIRTILVMNSLLTPVKPGVVQWRVGDDLFT